MPFYGDPTPVYIICRHDVRMYMMGVNVLKSYIVPLWSGYSRVCVCSRNHFTLIFVSIDPEANILLYGWKSTVSHDERCPVKDRCTVCV